MLLDERVVVISLAGKGGSPAPRRTSPRAFCTGPFTCFLACMVVCSYSRSVHSSSRDTLICGPLTHHLTRHLSHYVSSFWAMARLLGRAARGPLNAENMETGLCHLTSPR